MVHPSLNLCFLWHMHQPDYRGSDGVMRMPWVFLHAIKDYYEMPWLLSRHKGLKATFNITSTLIEQLNLYDDPLQNDYFLSLWEKHPSQLHEEEKRCLMSICKSTQHDTMVKPWPHFDFLYHKEQLSDEELIEFEVLFMLAWCGNYLRQENSLVARLIKKEKGYIQTDKTQLLQSLSVFIKTILPFYAALQKEGVISLSTTPYSHPILPLLIDINNAKYADIHSILPNNPMSLKEDAIEQVTRSILLYKKTFGLNPTGFWPAEGAIDAQSVSIYKEHGLHWIASDETILFRSLGSKARHNLYKPYRYNDMTIGFRDHTLSDFIGFNYRFKLGHKAAEHFMDALESIVKKEHTPTLFVILDGENAWEFFENNAYDFFTEIYQCLLQTQWCKTMTMDEMSKLESHGTLETLAPGSWINGNFNTWSGHPQKNRAWELIYQTRRDVENYFGVITDKVAKRVKSHFLAAECSDWFWWYGDDHLTRFSFEFDALFREHLIEIYHLLDMQPPSDLLEPILTHKSTASFLLKPQASISPLIDGKNSYFFEWLGSGWIDESKLYSTMDRIRGPIEKIYYGHNDSTIFIAFEGDITSLNTTSSVLQVTIEETGEHLAFAMDRPRSDKKAQIAVSERIELALAQENFKAYRSVHLRFEILEGKHIVQVMPGYGALFVDLDEIYDNNWFV